MTRARCNQVGVCALALSFLLLAITPLRADEKTRTSPPQRQRTGDRRRWEELKPVEKRRLEELHKRLESLDPQARAKLLERLRSVSPERRKTVLQKAKRELEKTPEDRLLKANRRGFVESQIGRLSPEEQKKFRQLSTSEKQEYFRKQVEISRQKSIARLPLALRERAEKLPPREQMKLLQGYQAERLCRRVFGDGEEGARLESRPREEVLTTLRASMRAPRNSSPPEWTSEPAWKRWQELKPFQRALILKHLSSPAADAAEPAVK